MWNHTFCMQGTHVFLNIYEEFVHSFKIIAHKILIRTYSVFVIFHSITFPKQYVLFEFRTSDYFFIKNTATLRASHNSHFHMLHYTHIMYGTIDTLWLIEAIVSILMKILRWSRTISLLFLRIFCIVDDIVHFIWMRRCINNYPHPVCEIDRYQLQKKNTSLHDILVFNTLYPPVNKLSFSHKIQLIYFPIYLLEACAYDLRFAFPESTTAQASNAARVRSQKEPDFQLFWLL